MNADIIKSLIGAGATIGTGLITWLLSATVGWIASYQYRRDRNLPNVICHWKCDWFWEDGKPYNSDDVYIEKWTRNGRFRGKGVLPNRTYAIDGEVDTTRVVALTYRTVDFPKKAYVGVACLKFDQDGDSLSGYWSGRARTRNLQEARRIGTEFPVDQMSCAGGAGAETVYLTVN